MKALIRISILALTLGCLGATAQTVQYVTLYTAPGMANYPVQTNQVISLVGFSWYYATGTGVYGNCPDGRPLNLTPFTANGAGVPSPIIGAQIPQMVTGLTNIGVSANGVNVSPWATFQITTPATANVISNYVPADAIVIPASATGDVQIILESSPDLVNWTAANPGTYGASSATNRFFRVRAVHN
jgi:hypothetical protein